MSGEPTEPIKAVSNESKQSPPEKEEPTPVDEPDAAEAETPEAGQNKVIEEPQATTTLGSYIVVGMLYFTIFIAIITLPYINAMLITVYFFIMFILLIGMTEVDQSARTALLGQMSIIYVLLLAFKSIELKGSVRLYDIDQLERYILVIMFVFLIPFILPYSIDFVNWIITREI